MGNNFFNNDEDEAFNDYIDDPEAGPVQVRMQNSPAPTPAPVDPHSVPMTTQQAEEYYDMVVGSDEEVEEDYTEVLSDARLRLEQGRLYEMIMNHNLFEGADADEKAIKNVTREIRNFAKERMEVMLGMRQEASKEVTTEVSLSLPFNSLEIEILKSLAKTASGGRTATEEAEAEQIVVPATPVRTGIKPINMPKGASKMAPVTRQPAKQAAPAAPKQPLRKAPTAPVNRVRSALEEQILREEGLTREQIDAVFPPNYKPLDKLPSQMTEQEFLERNKQVAKISGSTKKADSPLKIPMPDQDTENLLHAQRAEVAGANPQMQTIMSLLTQPKK